MIKKMVVVFILFILQVSLLGQGTDFSFEKFFKDKTMRLDYFHSGNFEQEKFAVDQVVCDGVWGGSKTVLLDQLNLGLYQFEVLDKATGHPLYSRGFASIFGEWQTIGEAKKQWGTFHESVRFPWPKQPVTIVMKKRDRENKFQRIWQRDIDPSYRQVIPEEQFNPYKVVPILENGPADQKVDIVVLGDGYTQKEEEKFIQDGKRLTGILMGAEPYRSRKKDFNIRAVFTPSPVSGVCRPHPGAYKRTPLSVRYSIFDSERYALTYDNRTVRNAASAVPYDFMIILINEKTYGGGGIYRLYATVAADNEFSDYIVIHEMGHHVAGLADEYYTSSVSYEVDSQVKVEPWEMNVTALLDPKNLKWRDLVKEGTPIPTPWDKKKFETFGYKVRMERQRLRRAKAPEAELEKLFKNQRQTEQKMFSLMIYKNQIGAFEGAAYMAKGMYRPSLNCIMFTRWLKFCPVCSRSLNLVFDQYSR